MLIWPLLITTVFASESSVEQYCFTNAARAQLMADKISIVLLPVDRLQLDQACFTINTPSHRRELIQSFIRRLEPQVDISFSSAQLRQEPCHLQVEKIKDLQLNTMTVGLQLKPEASASTTTKSSSEIMQIQTLQDFQLQVDLDLIKGQCKLINESSYEITLEVIKEPLNPSLPPGSIVVIPPPDVTQVSEGLSLKTQVRISRGERLEVGSIVRKLKEQKYQVSASPQSSSKTSQGEAREKVYLSLQ